MSQMTPEQAAVESAKRLLVPKPGSEVEREIQAEQTYESTVSAPPPAVAPQEVSEQEIAEQGTDEAFDLDPEVPPEIEALTSGPDFEYEPEAEAPSFEDEPEPEEEAYLDEEALRWKKVAEREAKKAAYYENLRLQEARSKWSAEAEKYFPLSSPAEIQATSHRDFIRQAKAQHLAMKPKFQKFIDAEKSTVREQARETWGTPVSGPPSPQSTIESQEYIQKMREAKSVPERIRLRMKYGDDQTFVG